MDDLLSGLPDLADEDVRIDEREEEYVDIENFQDSRKHELQINNKFPEVHNNIQCWWCRHSFHSKPVGCPTFFNRRKMIMHTRGIFCSYNCAAAYGTDTLSRGAVRFPCAWLCFMRKHVDGVKLSTPLVPAPHWTLLECFGGWMKIEQFRSQKSSDKRLKCIPSDLRLIPFGYCSFEFRQSKKKARAHVKLQAPPRTTEKKNISAISAKSNSNSVKKTVTKRKAPEKKKKKNIRQLLATIKVKTSRARKRRKNTTNRTKIVI